MSRLATAPFWSAHHGYEFVNAFLMRRALVLTDETARHPFLASLPPHVRQILPELDGAEGDPADAVTTQLSWWQISRKDARGIVSAYFATFVAALVFIM